MYPGRYLGPELAPQIQGHGSRGTGPSGTGGVPDARSFSSHPASAPRPPQPTYLKGARMTERSGSRFPTPNHSVRETYESAFPHAADEFPGASATLSFAAARNGVSGFDYKLRNGWEFPSTLCK